MPSIFEKIKEEQNQQSQSIFQQTEPTGKSIFQGVETIPTETPQQPTYSQEDLARKFIPQLYAGIQRQVPFGQRVTAPVPLEQMPAPQGLVGKLGAGTGSLLGMLPSFSVGGIGGGTVARGATKQLAKQLPRLAKYIGASAGGATTFMGAKALRNIGQNKPVQEGLPEEAGMGAIFGPTGLIRNPIGAVATSTALGAMIAPKGEKLSNAILFGGLTALTHQRPDLSTQDRTNIDTLYKEATFKEGVREVQRGIYQRRLPAPEIIYGEGFTAKPSGIPISIQKRLGFKQLQQLEYQPTLEQGALRQGEGFSVVGGKQIARPLAKGKQIELRTTPTPDEVIAKVQPQVQKDIQEARAKNIVSGVVVTPKNLEPIPQPTEGKVEEYVKSKLTEQDFKVIDTPEFQNYLRASDVSARVGEDRSKTFTYLQEKTGKSKVELEKEWGSAYPKPGMNLGETGYNKLHKLQELVDSYAKEDMSKLSTPTGEGKVIEEKPTIDISEPTISKRIGIVKPAKFGEVPYTQRQGIITGLKQEKHLLLPNERIELQNKLAEAISKAPEGGAKPLKIGIGNWYLSLAGDKKSLTDFSNIVNKRGSVVIPPEITEPITQTATKIYRGLAPMGEVLRNDKGIDSIMSEIQRKISEIRSGRLPQSMVNERLRENSDAEKAIQYINNSGGKDESIFSIKFADAKDKENMFNNKYLQILKLADKVGITKNSKPAETIFKALDYRRASPEEISKLTPDQQKFIPIFRNAYKEIWEATGKPEYESISDYATHIIETGKAMGYDVSPFGRFLPDELYSRYFEHRRGGTPYVQDIVEAFDAYVPSVARKIFREPVLEEFNKLESYLGTDFKNEAVDAVEAFLGRGKYAGQDPLGKLPRDLVRLTYRGTLYGNFSAATKNATQVLTNTIPEIGGKSVMYGYRKLMTPEGRQEFTNSGLSGDFSLGKPIDQLDFFSQVEFVNRGVTYLGAKQKALLEGKGLIEAERYATKIVRKTQFIQTGIDVPKLYRQYGSVGRILGQFTQFPTKQGFLIYNWARQGQWDKVARFATIAYLLGGTRTVPFLNGIIDGDYKHLPQMPDDMKKLVKNVERYTSLAGLSGMDIGQNFGFGIYSSGVPFARGPVASMLGVEIPSFIKGIATHEITNMKDIIRSRLVQKSLPTLVPGGSAMKKIIDLINADENDYKIRNAYNQLQYTSSPEEELLRVLVGPTKEKKEAWQSLSKERQESEIYRNDHRKMLDYILDSKGDTMALEEFIKKYPKYEISNITDELMERAKKREIPANIREYLTRPKALR